MRRHYRNHNTPFSRSQETNVPSNAPVAPRKRRRRRVTPPSSVRAGFVYRVDGSGPDAFHNLARPRSVDTTMMHRHPTEHQGRFRPPDSSSFLPSPPISSLSVSGGEEESEDESTGEASDDDMMDEDDELIERNYDYRRYDHHYGSHRLRPVTQFTATYSPPPTSGDRGHYHPQSDVRSMPRRDSSEKSSGSFASQSPSSPPLSPSQSSEGHSRVSQSPHFHSPLERRFTVSQLLR